METKKCNRVNLEKKRSMFFQVGLLFALGLTFVAFEWQVAIRISDVIWDPPIPVDVVDVVIPNTNPVPPPPPAPPLPNFELEIVDNDVDIGDVHIEILNVDEWRSNLLSPADYTPTTIGEEDEDIIFTPGEVVSALFNGKSAEDAFREYIAKNLMYPQVALDNGIFGKVFVQFVIDQKGNVIDLQVVRGTDPSLDNEALRLIKSTSGMWTPGKQGNKFVKVRYTFPIHFKLQ